MVCWINDLWNYISDWYENWKEEPSLKAIFFYIFNQLQNLIPIWLKMWTEKLILCLQTYFNVVCLFFSGFSNLVVLRLTDLVDPVDFRFREAEVKVPFKIIIMSKVFEHLITTNPQMVQWTMGALVGTIGTIRPIGLIITATTPRGPLCLTIGTDLIMIGQGNKISLR